MNAFSYVNMDSRRQQSRNTPFDHRDLHGVVHHQARDHRIGENRERLRPRQWHESRKTHARQHVPVSASAMRAATSVLLGIVAQNQRRSRADTMENAAK